VDTDLLFQLFGSAALAAVLGAVVNGVVNRRKLGAEATSIITQAAGGIVATLQADNIRLRAEAVVLKAQVDEFVKTDRRRGRRDDQMRRAFQAQSDYSTMCAHIMRAAGIEIADPPLVLFDFENDNTI